MMTDIKVRVIMFYIWISITLGVIYKLSTNINLLLSFLRNRLFHFYITSFNAYDKKCK